ncbi:Hypothetical predicted protein [Drosophila guanche]|uniref:Uncharacterized protein n=1 Tax=Drosophila guanche TaxID=7266 RepID=A0A3B0K3A0_DROGU|nr:Hypothetical predicted protein [Drosophila guanche]
MSVENIKRKPAGHDDAPDAKKAKVRTPTTSVLHLKEDCWRVVMDYLDVPDQLRLASSNVFIGEMFKRYASHRYKHIDETLAGSLDDQELESLLYIVGPHLTSYKSELNFGSYGDRLWLLRSYCTNLRNLKMAFRRTRWNDLNSLQHLKSLHAYLYFPDVDVCVAFVHNLKQFTCLRKLNLEADAYNGRDLHVLNQLESLQVGACPGFNATSLAECCQTMKQLRHLDFGYHIENISKNNFDILVRNCKQLERLAFGVFRLDEKLPYELVCQLPSLQHLKLWHKGSVRASLLEGLINKKGSPLESLILDGPDLREEQVKHLCNISTLKELDVRCDSVPLEDLLKLKNLLYLQISMPIRNDQLLDLLTGLPSLRVLSSRESFNVDASFVNSVRIWANEQREQRGKIKIYLQNSPKYLLENNCDDIEPLIEIINGLSLRDPILMSKKLSERV